MVFWVGLLSILFIFIGSAKCDIAHVLWSCLELVFCCEKTGKLRLLYWCTLSFCCILRKTCVDERGRVRACALIFVLNNFTAGNAATVS